MIITLTGPSCAGKSTLEKRLKAEGMVNAISTTTRHMREGEVDGQSYYFVNPHKFKFGISDGAFVEHVEFGGNHYGLEKAEIYRLMELGKDIVVVCEPNGQKQVAQWCKANNVPMLSVFVDGDSYTTARRFLSRMADDFQNVTPDSREKVINTYASRLNEMMTTERQWVEEARLVSNQIYDVYVAQFDPTTESHVINVILTAMESRQ